MSWFISVIGIHPKYSTGALVTSYMRYWVLLCAFLIWLPLLIMVTSFGCIYFKLRRSIKSFPYLSIQSRVARSRRKVISMLLILITVEIVCWSPWLYFVISQYVYMKGELEQDDQSNQVRLYNFCSTLNDLNTIFNRSKAKVVHQFYLLWDTTWYFWTVLSIHSLMGMAMKPCKKHSGSLFPFSIKISQSSNYKGELVMVFLPSKKPCLKSILRLERKLNKVWNA